MRGDPRAEHPGRPPRRFLGGEAAQRCPRRVVDERHETAEPPARRARAPRASRGSSRRVAPTPRNAPGARAAETRACGAGPDSRAPPRASTAGASGPAPACHGPPTSAPPPAWARTAGAIPWPPRRYSARARARSPARAPPGVGRDSTGGAYCRAPRPWRRRACSAHRRASLGDTRRRASAPPQPATHLPLSLEPTPSPA